jgi:hypothetical protein
LFRVKLTQDEAMLLKDLEFIANHLEKLSLSPEGDDSSTIVEGMDHNRSLSLHAILEESLSEHDSASSEEESSDFPIPKVCNAVISAIPIARTPPPEETPTPQIVPAVS